jgi:hypothetical protein
MTHPVTNFRDLIRNALFARIPNPGNRPGLVIFEAAFPKFDSEISRFLKNV